MHGVFVLTLPAFFGASCRDERHDARRRHDPDHLFAARRARAGHQPRPVVLVELPRRRRVPADVGRRHRCSRPTAAWWCCTSRSSSVRIAIDVHRRAGRGGRGPRRAQDRDRPRASTSPSIAAAHADRARSSRPPDGISPAFDGSSMTPCVCAARQAASRSASASSVERQDLRRQRARIRRVADGDGRDRDPARHLDDREQRVHARRDAGSGSGRR